MRSAGVGRVLESSEVGILAADFGAPAKGNSVYFVYYIVNVYYYVFVILLINLLVFLFDSFPYFLQCNC